MEKEKLYGTYVMIPCSHSARPDEKLEAIRKGLDRLLKKMAVWDIQPDFDTMLFIIHEGFHSNKSLDWYCKEKGEQIDDTKEVITVGIKFNGKRQSFKECVGKHERSKP